MDSDAASLYPSRFLHALAATSGIPDHRINRRVLRAFQEIVLHAGARLTLEVGAFEAGFSRWARENLPDAEVIAFEANPFVHARWKDEVLAAGVDYRNLAVGPESGPITLNVPRDFDGFDFAMVNQMASLSSNLRTEHTEPVEVDCVRLDDVVHPDDRPIAVWIDVEGATEVVLAGSEKTLRRASAVYIEVENTTIWDGQWLDVDVLRWFGEIGMVPVLRDLQRPFQYNLVFVSAELAADPWVVDLAARTYRRGPLLPQDEQAD